MLDLISVFTQSIWKMSRLYFTDWSSHDAEEMSFAVFSYSYTWYSEMCLWVSVMLKLVLRNSFSDTFLMLCLHTLWRNIRKDCDMNVSGLWMAQTSWMKRSAVCALFDPEGVIVWHLRDHVTQTTVTFTGKLNMCVCAENDWHQTSGCRRHFTVKYNNMRIYIHLSFMKNINEKEDLNCTDTI